MLISKGIIATVPGIFIGAKVILHIAMLLYGKNRLGGVFSTKRVSDI
jgi:hypothetical protein